MTILFVHGLSSSTHFFRDKIFSIVSGRNRICDNLFSKSNKVLIGLSIFPEFSLFLSKVSAVVSLIQGFTETPSTFRFYREVFTLS